MKHLRIGLWAAIALAASGACAETITLTYAGKNAYTGGPLCADQVGGTYFWSDSLAPHADADYSAGTAFFSPIWPSAKDWTFAGNSLDLNTTMNVMTLKPATLCFTNILRVSNYGTITLYTVGTGNESYFDLTAKEFQFARIQLNAFVNWNPKRKGGITLHGKVTSVMPSCSVEDSSKYVSVTGCAEHPDCFADFDGDCSGFKGSVRVSNATITGSSGFPNTAYFQLGSNCTIRVKSSGFAVKGLRSLKGGAWILFDTSSGSIGALTMAGSGESSTYANPVKLKVSDLKALPKEQTFVLVKRPKTSGAIPSFLDIDPSVTNGRPRAVFARTSDANYYYMNLKVERSGLSVIFR